MKTLPSSIRVEKNKYDSANPFLFLLDLTLPNTVEVGIRLVRNTANVWFAGYEYIAFPFEVENRGEASKGEIPTIVLKVSNVSRELRSYITEYGGMVNSKVTLSVVSYDVTTDQVQGTSTSTPLTSCVFPTANKDYINKTNIGNLTSIGSYVTIISGNGVITGMYVVKTIISANSIQLTTTCHSSAADIINGVVSVTPATIIDYADLQVTYTILGTNYDINWITFQLGAAYITRRRFPLNRYIPNSCQWLRNFKDLECGYTGTITKCDGTLEDCRRKGNSVRFGGYRGLGSGNLRLC